MSESKQERVTFTNQVIQITDRAICLGESGNPKSKIENPKSGMWIDKSFWIPRSQILDCDADLDELEIGEEITVEIPMWLAREKGLVEG